VIPREKITWGRVSYTLYFIGTALIVGSWVGIVPYRIGWMGWVISMIGWAIPHFITWQQKRRQRGAAGRE